MDYTAAVMRYVSVEFDNSRFPRNGTISRRNIILRDDEGLRRRVLDAGDSFDVFEPFHGEMHPSRILQCNDLAANIHRKHSTIIYY